MKANIILQTALNHFAKEGYEGASLGNIAQEVGIKKPSIYAHYASKDDLFLSALHYAVHTQKARLASYFRDAQEQPLEELLFGYFSWFAKESEENEMMTFILRMAYFPPLKLEKEVNAVFDPFFEDLHRHLARLLRERHKREQVLYNDDFESLALSYMTLAEASMIDLVYSSYAFYKRRVHAVWPVFWRGMTR